MLGKIRAVLKKPNPLLNISFVTFGNIFNAGLGFVFLAAVAKSLQIEDFGKYALLTSLLVSLGKIVDFGTNSTFVANTLSKAKRNFDTFISTKFFLFSVAFVISLIALKLLNFADPALLAIFIIGLVGYSINFTFFALFQETKQYTPLILLNTLPAVIKLIFATLVFSKVITLNLTEAFSIFALSILSSGFLYFVLPIESKHLLRKPKNPFKLLKQATPAGISQLINEGWPAISNTIAKIARGFNDVGIFSIAEKIAHIFALVSLSIFTVLLPKNAERKKQKLGYDMKETATLAGVVLVLALIGITTSRVGVPILFGEKFTAAIPLLDKLILASALTAIHTFMENYFFVEERVGSILSINFIKLGTFLGLAWFLVPTQALQGLANAHLVAALVALSVTGFLIRKSSS